MSLVELIYEGKNLQNNFDELPSHHRFALMAGWLVILFCGFKFTLALIKYVRLYFLNQLLSSRASLRKKYGQWALITGATDGIGYEIAHELARCGMSLILVGRNEEKLAKTKRSLVKEPKAGDIITCRIDLADSSIDNYRRIRDQIDPDNRDIGVLVNNAGMVTEEVGIRFESLKLDEILAVTNVNFLAPMLFTSMVLPGMVKRKRGLIVNNSSLMGTVPFPFAGMYPCTKACLIAFSKILQIEYSSSPIDIVCLTPAFVRTGIFNEIATLPSAWPFVLRPNDYARTALNALASANYKIMAGTFFHEMICIFAKFASYLGILPNISLAFFKFYADDRQRVNFNNLKL